MVILLAIFLILATPALADETFYDAGGRVVARSVTVGDETTTYDASGKVVARTVRRGNEEVTYDASGRVVGRTVRRK